MSFAGFDTSIYPGDSLMQKAKDNFPYTFCGYYLKAPCHHNPGWMGKRATLVAMGWNCLIVYVGQQAAGVSPCNRNVTTAAQGALDATDAAAITAAEGFPAGSAVYLDVERVDPGTPALASMMTYVQAWFEQMLTTDFIPAVYCHRKNAQDVQQAVAASGAGPDVRFWVVGSGVVPFTLDADPTDSGIAFAAVWQNPVSITKNIGGTNLNMDEDVSNLADPSAP